MRRNAILVGIKIFLWMQHYLLWKQDYAALL